MSFMNPKILTDLECKKIKAYLKDDGEKDVYIRQLVFRGKRFLPHIKQDLELLERLVQVYESHVRKDWVLAHVGLGTTTRTPKINEVLGKSELYERTKAT